MKILILGCGPAGLLACHAAQDMPDTQVIILSRRVKSMLHGCQFLHEPIPFTMPLESTTVDYQLRGTVAGYARKVYGTDTLPVTSPQLYSGPRPAWNVRQAYDWLWTRYHDLIIHTELSPAGMAETFQYFGPDLTLSTVPAPLLCQRGGEHVFSHVRCWAIGDAPEEGQSVPFSTEQPDTILCDGTEEHGYYRVSNVFGRTTIEWPGRGRRPPLEGVVAFDKPLSTTCDCWPQVQRLGRYGRWKKGVLAHHVYADTHNLLAAIAQR